MIQQGYYEIDSSSDALPMNASGDASNNTPFSVKDILNLVDQGDHYLGCHVEK